MEFHQIKEITRKIIAEIVASNNESDEKPIMLGDDDSLIDSGLIDSISSVQLIEDCIQKFDVIIHPAELSLENFDTVNRICNFIRVKLEDNNQ